ncbi:MAG: hypothetical protein LC778_19835 [Acidobacteria bacterium]|nr:hypothetical protein [Acidobacteriota bacterium]
MSIYGNPQPLSATQLAAECKEKEIQRLHEEIGVLEISLRDQWFPKQNAQKEEQLKALKAKLSALLEGKMEAVCQ